MNRTTWWHILVVGCVAIGLAAVFALRGRESHLGKGQPTGGAPRREDAREKPINSEAVSRVQPKLERFGSIVGQVRSKSTKEAVSNVRIVLTSSSKGEPSAKNDLLAQDDPEMLTDGDGRFCFKQVPPGAYNVGAFVSGRGRGYSKKIQVRPREQQEVVIEVSVVLIVKGNVKTQDARRVDLGEFSVVTAGTGDVVHTREVRLFADGSYALPYDKIPDGAEEAPIRFEFATTGYLVALSNEYRLQLGTLTGVDFTLDAGGKISGTVTDLQGNPIPGADLSAVGSESTRRVQHAKSDERGRYAIRGLSAGTYRVRGECRGYVPSFEKRTVELTESGSQEGVDIQLDHGLSLSGCVKTSGSAPVSRAIVRVKYGGTGGAAVTAEDGSFRISGIDPRGKLAGTGTQDRIFDSVTVQARGYSALELSMIPADSEQTFVLHGSGSLRVQVNGVKEEVLKKGILLAVTPLGVDGSMTTWHSIYKKEYTFADLVPGLYSVVGRAPGYATPRLTAGVGERLETTLDVTFVEGIPDRDETAPLVLTEESLEGDIKHLVQTYSSDQLDNFQKSLEATLREGTEKDKADFYKNVLEALKAARASRGSKE